MLLVFKTLEFQLNTEVEILNLTAMLFRLPTFISTTFNKYIFSLIETKLNKNIIKLKLLCLVPAANHS